jgi:hypothetical protein
MLYINGLSTRFAADKACKGVTVFVTREDSFSNPTKAPLLAKPHSTLLVDFVLDSERQGWGLTAPDAGLMGLGQEGPDGIAATVCNIVGKRGAKIIQ